MDLAEIVRVLRRRWYVLLPGLLLAAGLVVAVTRLAPVRYQSQSTVVLLNSQKATLAYDGNPFLSTQTSLTGMADSLARNLNSDDSLRDLKSRGAQGTFEAKLADNAQGPLLWLTVTGTDRSSVLASDRILTAYAKERLDQFQRQQSVAPKAMIRMTTIVPPQNPVAQTKTRIEYMVMAGALGLVLTLVTAFYVEARLRPRPQGRRTGPGAEPDLTGQRLTGDQFTGPRLTGSRRTEPERGEPRPADPEYRNPEHGEPGGGEPGPGERGPGEPQKETTETLAIRRTPTWSRSAADGPAAAEPDASWPTTAVASAAEPLEEPTHGHRPRTGHRNR